jgi:uncharacterized protein (TIGR01244 family)
MASPPIRASNPFGRRSAKETPVSEFKKVTDDFFVSPQLSLDDVRDAKGRGFVLIINNRPDGEAPGQPSGAAIAAAAREAGLDYVYAPVVGRPSPEAIDSVRRAVDGSQGPVLAFCRSGTRSICAWALGRTDRMDSDELVRLGHAAGYDLSAIL